MLRLRSLNKSPAAGADAPRAPPAAVPSATTAGPDAGGPPQLALPRRGPAPSPSESPLPRALEAGARQDEEALFGNASQSDLEVSAPLDYSATDTSAAVGSVAGSGAGRWQPDDAVLQQAERDFDRILEDVSSEDGAGSVSE